MLGKSLRWPEAYVGFSVDVCERNSTPSPCLYGFDSYQYCFPFADILRKPHQRVAFPPFQVNFRETETAKSFHVLVRYDFF